MAETEYDLVVIGSGPGGYVCAVRAAGLGLKTALVEKNAELGGTCLNVGCIPSKALLHSSEMFHFTAENAASHGIKVGKPELDLATMMKRKDEVVGRLNKGIAQLMKVNKITVLHGLGTLKGDGKVSIKGENETTTVTAKHIVLATGSASVELPFLKFDGKTVVSSDEAVAFDSVPEKLVVVGAGAIGLELGSVWARLGSKVTVVELLPQIAPTFDKDVSRTAERFFKRQGIHFELGAKVTGLERDKKATFLTAEKKDKQLRFEADKILVAVGRRPRTETIGAEAVGLKLDKGKRIIVDDNYRTNLDNVYAIGDSIAGPMLAHKAEEEGAAVAELIAGQAGHVNYAVIPNVIYTDPEIASVGIGEDQAKEKGIEVKVGKFSLAANGRAIASDATDGFVKVIADKKTDRILGVQIIARGASEIIADAVAHMEYGGSAEDLARTVHAHPTISESLKEAALSAWKA